jgi:hypothetical protein
MAKASDRKIAANRANAKKSSGPKTPRGRSISSRNARRHGMTAPPEYSPAEEQDVEKLAWALCNSVGPDKELIAKARVLAQETAFHAKLVKLRLHHLNAMLETARCERADVREKAVTMVEHTIGGDIEDLARLFLSAFRRFELDDLYLNRSARRMKRAMEEFRRSYGDLPFARHEEFVIGKAFDAALARGFDGGTGKPKKLRAPRRPALTIPRQKTSGRKS